MTRSDAIDTVTAYFDEGRFQAELADLVGYETESQNPEQAAELARYLEQAMTPGSVRWGFPARPTTTRSQGPDQFWWPNGSRAPICPRC